MSSPRILITASTVPRWQGDIEPEFILQLAARLQPEFQVTVLAPHDSGALPVEFLDGVEIRRFRYAPLRWQSLAYSGGMLHKLKSQPLRWLLVPGFLLAQMLAIHSLHRKRQFDLIHAHWIVPQGLAAAVLSQLGLYRGPLLLTSHGGDLFSLAGPLLARLKRWVLGRATRVNVVSQAMVDPCLALGVPRADIVVRSMGVDLDDRFVASTAVDERQGLIFVGRLVEKKGVAVLIAAFAQLLKKLPEQQLTIVGHGPLEAELRQLCVTLGCADHVHFTGAVANEDVPRYLNAARIAIVPSVVAADGDQEGLGLVAVEAMGCGCVVIASDLPALRDVVDPGVCGLLVPPGDSNALAGTIIQLLGDDELYARLATAAPDYAHRHSWKSAAADFKRIYAQLINAFTGSG